MVPRQWRPIRNLQLTRFARGVFLLALKPLAALSRTNFGGGFIRVLFRITWAAACAAGERASESDTLALQRVFAFSGEDLELEQFHDHHESQESIPGWLRVGFFA